MIEFIAVFSVSVMVFWGIVSAIKEENKGNTGQALNYLFLTLFWFILLVWATYKVKEIQYKYGQIDAIQGDIKYELKVTPDSTWIEK